MKITLLLILALPCMVQAQSLAQRKPCEELKSEIAAKIEAKGVKAYTLSILPADARTDARIVGSCDGGTQRIAYRRTQDVVSSTRELAAVPQ